MIHWNLRVHHVQTIPSAIGMVVFHTHVTCGFESRVWYPHVKIAAK